MSILDRARMCQNGVTIKTIVVDKIQGNSLLIREELRLSPRGRFTCGVGNNEDKHSMATQRLIKIDGTQVSGFLQKHDLELAGFFAKGPAFFFFFFEH